MHLGRGLFGLDGLLTLDRTDTADSRTRLPTTIGRRVARVFARFSFVVVGRVGRIFGFGLGLISRLIRDLGGFFSVLNSGLMHLGRGLFGLDGLLTLDRTDTADSRIRLPTTIGRRVARVFAGFSFVVVGRVGRIFGFGLGLISSLIRDLGGFFRVLD